jgi:hypothetical protein
VDNLRNQLAFALACSPSLGGAFTKESSGALGSEALSELGIRFARSARRVQRALISGIIRLCQIHLAYMGLDPDPNLFTVHMSETSTAEEAQILKGMENGMNVLQKMIKTMKMVAGKRVDKLKLWEYFNEKLLRLEDFHLADFFKSPETIKKELEVERMKALMQQGGEEGPPKELGDKLESLMLDIFNNRLDESFARMKEKASVKRRIENLDEASYYPAVVQGWDKKLLQEKYKGVEPLKIKEKSLPKVKESSWLEKRDGISWFEQFGGATLDFKDKVDKEETVEV